ncbi:MAG TPA: KUP/HAK/KT family potassium transporter [Baekduia sp.]|nr:KUP/HAK/KT family potassium transporter [Baekduia sp.]
MLDARHPDELDHPVRTARPPLRRHSLNEAAHKLGEPYEVPRPPAEHPDEESLRRLAALSDHDHDVVARAGRAVLVLGALGVVYGDIGTSPLYTEQVIFGSYGATADVTPATAYGVVSLIFWALTIVVSVKYAGFIMRAHNRGDGGIMALTALLQRSRVARRAALATLGVFGAALFFGDGIITPAISVMGSLQGLEVAAPGLSHLVLPLSLGVLVGLFVLQRFGSAAIGRLFGPVIVVWFVAIGLIGLAEVVQAPAVLQGLSPTWGVRFLATHGVAGCLVLGGVVLAVTGAEALYADRGHFGAAPIRIGWFALALPALTLNYLGQAAMIQHDPATAANPFFLMAPGWARYPLLILATAATIIASQAAISGSFSVARQAVQLGFLPRLRIVHTSDTEGQIYVPVVNWALCAGVVVLALAFRSADRLGDVYGVAVTGTFILNTVLFVAVARLLWGSPRRRLVPVALLFLTVEVTFFSANIAKIAHGAWLPLAVGLLLSLVMINWRRGQAVVTRNRRQKEGSLSDFLAGIHHLDPPPVRVPGVAVFLNPGKDTTPLALRAQVEHSHTLLEHVLIVSMENVGIPHVGEYDRLAVQALGHGTGKVTHVTVRVGYQDQADVPEALRLCRKHGLLERNLDLEDASYFLSSITIRRSGGSALGTWRKRLFIAMARNAASPVEHFGLPADRTVTLGSQVAL